jgi:pilus assembly protein CpaB
VDILHTEGQGHVSRTILTNIPVLAIDQLVDEKGKEDKSKATVIGRTATLELNPEQAETLAAAQVSGTLSLSLRSAADINDPRRPASQTIRVIRAGHTETVKTQ